MLKIKTTTNGLTETREMTEEEFVIMLGHLAIENDSMSQIVNPSTYEFIYVWVFSKPIDGAADRQFTYVYKYSKTLL